MLYFPCIFTVIALFYGKEIFPRKTKRDPQVNRCKFTRCKNFGLTPEGIQALVYLNNDNKNIGDRQPVKVSDYYVISGTGNKSSSILCKGCVEFS